MSLLTEKNQHILLTIDALSLLFLRFRHAPRMTGQNIVQLNSKKIQPDSINQWDKLDPDFFLDELSVFFLDFIVLQTAKMLMFYHDPSQIEDKKKTHSSPSFCNPLLLLTEAIRFMRRLVVCTSKGEVAGFASDCWAWLAIVWGIGVLPFNGGFDSPLTCPRPRDCQALPLPVPRWTSLLFMLLVLDISALVEVDSGRESTSSTRDVWIMWRLACAS